MNRQTKRVVGWSCDCTGEDWHSYGAQECPRRRSVYHDIPVYPDENISWTSPRHLAKPEADKVRPPIVRCRLVDGEPIPPRAKTILRQLRAIGEPGRLTYAQGWSQRKTVVGHAPEEEGGGEICRFVPCQIESVALRSRILTLVWTRREGEQGWQGWKSLPGYTVWGRRIFPVGVRDGSKVLTWLEQQITN